MSEGRVTGDRATVTESGAVNQEVSRLRGLLFQAVCLGATLFGIAVVSFLLLYVAGNAFRPFSADPRWHLVYAATFLVPVALLGGYYLLWDRTAGAVAYTALGVPVVGLFAGGGLLVLFAELLTAQGWTALLVALLVAGAAVGVHRRYRREAALERLGVLLVAPFLAVFGVPPFAVSYTVTLPFSGTTLGTIAVSTPRLLPSVRDLVFALPVLPVDWLLLLATVTLPAALAGGRYVARRRDDDRGRRAVPALATAAVGAAALGAPLAGLAPSTGVLVATATLLPTGVYLEGVLRRREGLSGLLFPVVVAGGLAAGTVVTGALGFAGPDPWLDWSFLTGAPSRTPSRAGIYPPLVGSVLIIVVIALSAFPVGVGAAVYLEEYAPDTGRLGRVVDLVEVNIGNLAGVPSVVYGLLGLALFVRGVGFRSGTVVVGGLTVGLLVLPIVIISAQESIRAVPDSMRQASYGMGATRWQTVRDVVLPEALPGILTGTILALGRAIGETAPLLMIGIAASVRTAPAGFFSRTGAMPRQIFTWSSELQPEFRYGVLAAGVVTLLVVLLLMNGTAIVVRNRFQRTE